LNVIKAFASVDLAFHNNIFPIDDKVYENQIGYHMKNKMFFSLDQLQNSYSLAFKNGTSTKVTSDYAKAT